MDPPDLWNDLIWNQRFAVLRWNETWGEFRLAIDAADEEFALGNRGTVRGLSGWLLHLGDRTDRETAANRDLGTIANPETWQRWAIGGLFLTCVLGYAAVVQFGMRFQLTQARYFFPMIPAASVLVMIGLHTIAVGKARVYAQVLVIAGMLAVNIYIFTAYVLPYWYVRADSRLLLMFARLRTLIWPVDRDGCSCRCCCW
ncbi:MAG: hypothetical protein R2843_10255 [Thermomicrobiales bacterium]